MKLTCSLTQQLRHTWLVTASDQRHNVWRNPGEQAGIVGRRECRIMAINKQVAYLKA
jgi:hypothetical protein